MFFVETLSGVRHIQKITNIFYIFNQLYESIKISFYSQHIKYYYIFYFYFFKKKNLKILVMAEFGRIYDGCVAEFQRWFNDLK
jgi:hypothetical protein